MFKTLMIAAALLSFSVTASAEWTKGLSMGVSGSLESTNNNPQKVDGETIKLNGSIDGNYDYEAGNHAWKNSLIIRESLSKDTSLDEYVNSRDMLYFATEYQYAMPSMDWLKAYAKASVDTHIFKAETITAAPVTYQGDSTATTNKLRTADGFENMNIRLTVGVLAELINEENTTLNGRLGFGAQQILADGALRVEADGETVTALSDADSLGIEAGLYFDQVLNEKSKLYATIETFTPVDYNVDDAALEAKLDDKNEFELTDVTITAGLESEVTDWMSMRYSYEAKQTPFTNGSSFQVDHGFYITATYTVF